MKWPWTRSSRLLSTGRASGDLHCRESHRISIDQFPSCLIRLSGQWHPGQDCKTFRFSEGGGLVAVGSSWLIWRYMFDDGVSIVGDCAWVMILRRISSRSIDLRSPAIETPSFHGAAAEDPDAHISNALHLRASVRTF